MSAALDHEVILASAGSGKTYQLTTRFLRLVVGGVDPVNIVAATFTRAAAAEIRDRIVSKAATAVVSADAREELAEAIGMPLDEAGALRLLQRLAHGWHRLQVRTLDSLLGGIVGCFGPELGVPPGAAVIDPLVDTELRRAATRRLLATWPPEVAVAVLRQLTAGSSDLDVAGAIDDVVRELHDLWREAAPEAWASITPAAPLSDEQVERAISTLARLAESTTARSLARAAGQAVTDARREDWETVLGKGLGAKILDGEVTYQNREIPPAMREEISTLVAHGTAVLREGIRTQTLATRDLIEAWARHYDQLKLEERAVTFGDLPFLVARAESLGSLEEIGYRLDGRMHHLLLDEMQDTSVAQWEALRPFAEEIWSQVAGERSFFCVGDLKQSIYGWRGAAPEILRGIAENEALRSRRLHRTYRCAPRVVDAVNQVFGAVASVPATAEIRGAAHAFASAFDPHESTSTAPGFVELRTAGSADRDAGVTLLHQRLTDAASLVARLHALAPAASIGVLVRRNAAVARLLVELGPSRHGLPAAGRGGAALTDAPAVEAVLSLLRLAFHPGHTVAAFHVAHSPLGAVVGLEASPAQPPTALDRSRVARAVRRRLESDGLAATVQQWTSDLAAACDPRSHHRLIELCRAASSWESRGGDCRGFIASVESTDVADEAVAPIQVMTVHQAKGLEFDLVILPELDAALVDTSRLLVASRRPDDGRPATDVVRWVRRARTAGVPEANAIMAEETQRQGQESLCLLYVAMTRARRGLYMLVDPAASGQRRRTAAALVRESLGVSHDEPGAVIWRNGDESEMLAGLDAGSGRTRGAEVRTPRAAAIRMAPTEALRGGPVAPPSSDATPRSPLAALRGTAPAGRVGRDQGIGIHALLERITWLEEGIPGEDARHAILRQALPRRDAGWIAAQAEAFPRLLEAPAIRSLLSRGASTPDSLDVRTETPFVRRTARGLQRGVVDRLVLRRDRERVVGVTVIDFKSDETTPAAVTRLVERDRVQLEAYRAAMAERYGLERSAVTAVLAYVRAGLAVTVDDVDADGVPVVTTSPSPSVLGQSVRTRRPE